MKTFSKKSLQSILGLLATFLLVFAFQVEQVNAQKANPGNVCLITTNTSASVNSVMGNCASCGNCIVTVVGSSAYYVNQGGKAGNNMKVIKGAKAVKAEDIAKIPGLAKFRPFRGNDNVQLSCSANTLIFNGNGGTASENPLDLCKDNGNQQCANPTTWVVTNNNPASNDSYTFQPDNDKSSSLCFVPATGLTMKRQEIGRKSNTRTPDECTLWAITPTAVGADGQITGYKITPKNHPDYVLAANIQTSQIVMRKVNAKNQDSAELESGVMTHWNFKSVKSNSPVSNQQKVSRKAGEN
ncbi:MAG: hypothetical protein K9I85_11590 [Saprospiraceae bacterium]|nr:hypothetical protein [Saprospiraceae bacterium]